MIVLKDVTGETITPYARKLLNKHRSSQYSTFETTAQALVQEWRSTFVTEGHEPAFALVRIYRLSSYSELAPELVPLVDPTRERWMTLMGTTGKEAAWNDRHQSTGHKFLNLGADESPMVSAAAYQLGLDFGVERPGGTIDMPIPEASLMTRYFHIEQAMGSPYIPAQEPFVKPYGIQWVFGVGSGFLSGSAYVVLAFSREASTTAQATHLAQLSPYISTLLAYYDQRSIWNPA
jgi:hypothetical protein